jgi:hypothetical protein
VTFQASTGTEGEKEVSQKEKKSKKRAKKKKGGQAQGSLSLYPSQQHLMSRYKFNPETGHTMDMMQDEDWSLCDKECGWCGHCAEAYDI